MKSFLLIFAELSKPLLIHGQGFRFLQFLANFKGNDSSAASVTKLKKLSKWSLTLASGIEAEVSVTDETLNSIFLTKLR